MEVWGRVWKREGMIPSLCSFMARLIGKLGGSILSPDPLTQLTGSHLTHFDENIRPFALVPGKTLSPHSLSRYSLPALWLVRTLGKVASIEHMYAISQQQATYLRSTFNHAHAQKKALYTPEKRKAELLLGWMLSLADP